MIMALIMAAMVTVTPGVSYQKGVAFLLTHQNQNGSWGGPQGSADFDIMASAPGSFRAFGAATTALCVMALRTPALTDPLARAGRERGIQYLLREGGVIKRETRSVIYSVWAHGYALEALSQALQDDTRTPEDQAAIRTAAQYHLDHLGKYETTWGGWNYYDFSLQTRQPSMEPVSFTTASILLNLYAAQQAGLVVPAPLVARALNVLEKCRKPDGSYLYGYNHRHRPLGWGSRDKGSLGRSQSGNLALFTFQKTVTPRHLLDGMEKFFAEHRFLEIGRKRQYPHEAWYNTSGYYYYFGHYYAGGLLPHLLPVDQKRMAAELAAVVVPHQEADGSWWDYKLFSYHWAYGTALALMTLESCLPFLK